MPLHKHDPLHRRRVGHPGVVETSAKEPPASSASGDRDAGARSSDLGVMTTNGVVGVRRTWARSRWKYWAAVEGTATRRFPRAHRDRNRSIRADECSGPWPS